MQFQSDIFRSFSQGMDLERLLRSGSGADRVDDRKLPVRISLAANATLSLHYRRPAPRGFCRRLAEISKPSVLSLVTVSLAPAWASAAIVFLPDCRLR